MRRLRDENLKECFSLLKTFIEGTPEDSQKGVAILALNQLRKISAGLGSSGGERGISCASKPMADAS